MFSEVIMPIQTVSNHVWKLALLNLIFSEVYICANSTDVKWYLIWVLIFISFVTNEISVFPCFQWWIIFSWGIHSGLFPKFLWKKPILHINCPIPLYILHRDSLSPICVAGIFSQFVIFSFFLVISFSFDSYTLHFFSSLLI